MEEGNKKFFDTHSTYDKKHEIHIEHLSKAQIVLLVLFASFVVSIATGIVTVTLLNQAPPPVTQTINRVIERTVEKVIPGDVDRKDVQTIIITQEDIIVSIVEDASPAVVSVVATKDLPVIEEYFISPFEGDSFPGLDIRIPQYRQNGTEKRQVSSGTGFFVSNDGLVMTNKHVVEDSDASYSVIMNNGDSLDVEVLARDPFQDIAILKIKDGEEKEFQFLPLGDSDNLKIGRAVIAIGNALGEFKNTVSVGIVSGLNRDIVASGAASGDQELQQLIQTDAAINQGNSGGPLLNLNGEVIGINTAVAKGAENLGFAMPINFAKRDVQDAREFGEIKYPFIGVRYQVVTSKMKEEKELSVDYGLILVSNGEEEPAVLSEGPAAEAGLKAGDIILEIGKVKLDKAISLVNILNRHRVGDRMTLKFTRDGEENIVDIVLGERPENL